MQIRIREFARKRKKWSLYRLSKKLEMPQQTIYSWANGRTQPSYENMDKLCSVLNCLPNDLFVPDYDENLIKAGDAK